MLRQRAKQRAERRTQGVSLFMDGGFLSRGSLHAFDVSVACSLCLQFAEQCKYSLPCLSLCLMHLGKGTERGGVSVGFTPSSNFEADLCLRGGRTLYTPRPRY